MLNKNETIKMLKRFESHTEMYVGIRDYIHVTSFILGMNYYSNGKMLDGIDDWLREEYEIWSQLYWDGLISEIFRRKVKCNKRPGSEKQKVDFLFEVIVRYLSEKPYSEKNEKRIPSPD